MSGWQVGHVKSSAAAQALMAAPQLRAAALPPHCSPPPQAHTLRSASRPLRHQSRGTMVSSGWYQLSRAFLRSAGGSAMKVSRKEVLEAAQRVKGSRCGTCGTTTSAGSRTARRAARAAARSCSRAASKAGITAWPSRSAKPRKGRPCGGGGREGVGEAAWVCAGQARGEAGT